MSGPRRTQTFARTLLERVQSAFRRHDVTVRAITLLVVGGGLVATTVYAYPRTTDGTYAREVVVAALGAVVTVLGAGLVAMVSLWRQIRRRREAAVLDRFDRATWSRSAITVGRMSIPDIVVVASGTHRTPWTETVRYEFTEGAARNGAPDLADLRDSRLPAVLARARREGIALADDPCVDLVGANVRLERDDAGRRRRVYELRHSEATYFDFLTTTADLDGAVQPGVATTLRQHWDTYPVSIDDVSRLPALAKVGVGTAVVTSDDRIVLGVRGRTFIAGQGSDPRRAVHIVAEGMVPGDLDRHGRVSPDVTARRGMAEELGLSDDRRAHGRVTTLDATGFFFDQQRWQPCFAYAASVDTTWDELQTAASTASDYWEVEGLLALPFSIRDAGVRHLLTGTHPDLVLASNHAGAVLWFALLYKHGFTEMRDELTGHGAVHRPARRSPGD